MPDAPKPISRVEALLAKIRSQLKPGLADPIQKELAEWLSILPDLSEDTDAALVATAEIAVDSLLSETPNVVLATSSRENIELRLRRRRNPLMGVLRGGSPPTRVILGLGTLLYFAIPFGVMFLPRLTERKDLFGLEMSSLTLVAVAGGLGSVVSIMVRIQDFSALTKIDPAILFFTGFFKPVIGMSFALFVFSALNAGLLPLAIDTSKEPQKAQYFFLALAFVAGFSERFARDIVTKTESSATGSGSQTSV